MNIHLLAATLAPRRISWIYNRSFPACRTIVLPVQLPQGEFLREITQGVLREINHSYKDTYGQSFSESLVKFCGRSEGLERRKTPAEKKKAVRNLQRKFRDSTNQEYASTAALSFLSSNESLRDYQCKCLAQSFELSSATKRSKSHVPSSSNRSCDTGSIVKEVQDRPEGKKMNWSEVARNHGVTHHLHLTS